MNAGKRPLDLLFLGSGNAFGAEGRAFSTVLLNGRYLFDCGPTLLQQLQKTGVDHGDIEAVFISHFHADHFFGLPFLFLASHYEGRERDLTVVGPPGIEERTRALTSLGYTRVLDEMKFGLRFVEVSDGLRGQVCGLNFSAAEVEHVGELTCFAYRAEPDGRSMVYSGDTKLCEGLLRLSDGADVIVLELSAKRSSVHLSPEGVAEVAKRSPEAQVILTHLDGKQHGLQLGGVLLAQDGDRYRL